MRFREWLTLEEAAAHLATVAAEPVSEADLLRLALDGHLTLSANFVNHAVGRIGRMVPLEEAEILDVPALNGEGRVRVPVGVAVGHDKVIQWFDAVGPIDGVWDLTMFGAESIDLEYRFQRLTGGPRVELHNLDGPIVQKGALYA